MRFLHLSDIHFKQPDCLEPHRHPEVAYRTRLESDLRDLCKADQIRVDAILVGGDIAYAGHPDEYKAAKEWLLKVARICGCTAEGIFTVPGNHDVDRKIAEGPAVSAMQQAVAVGKTVHERDEVFRHQLKNVDAARLLFSPVQAYNDFAAQFDCAVYPERPFWIHELHLSDDVTLRLFGLTSTFISGAGDRDKAPARLFLGSSQTSVNPEDDVVNLVLCHHPPSWFTDSSEANNIINARVMLQFFGHEHDQRCDRLPSYIRFSAGAVNPERDKPGWNPGYNLIDVNVVGAGGDRAIEIHGRLRRLQPPPTEFYVPLEPKPGQLVWYHKLELPKTELFVFEKTLAQDPLPAGQRETKMAKAVHLAVQEVGVEPARPRPEEPQEVTMPEPSTQDLAYRYWQLSGSQMREIALSLKLIDDADIKAPPHERYSKALKAAKDQGLFVELARKVEQYEKKS